MAIIKIFERESSGIPNCNGGNYPQIIATENGIPVWAGFRCGCWGGCSNTTSRNELFDLFPDWNGEVKEITSSDFSNLLSLYVAARP